MELYKEMAKSIDGKFPHVKCEKCGKKHVLNQLTISNYLQFGWPKCCGYTMTYYKD